MTKTYLQLAREIATLQAAADKQLIAEKKEAVAHLNEIIAKYGFSAAELKFPGTGAPVAKPGPKVKSTSRSAMAGAKYADGTGNTWGGRGPRPAWLRNAIAGGKSLESFMGSTASAASAAQPVTASASVDSLKKSGYTVAPKYRHPGTGDTWSGRGSAPRWLKEALRKRATKLDDFLIAKPSATGATSRPTGAAVSAGASRTKSVAPTKSLPKPVASAKSVPVKAFAAKKVVASKTRPKNAPVAKKPVAKKSAKATTPGPVVPPTKTPAAKKQAVAVPQRKATKGAATSAKPARKTVAGKKATTEKTDSAANAAALSPLSSASEKPVASPIA